MYLAFLCISFVHFAHGQLTEYCTGNETLVASETPEKLVSDHLMQEFLADGLRTTMDISLKFNQSAICQLHLHDVTKFQCGLFFSEAVWNKMGEVVGNPDNRKSIQMIEEDGFSTQDAPLSGLQSGKRYIFGLDCSLEFLDGRKSALSSEHWEAATTGFLGAPSLLKAFVNSHMHGLVNESRWIMLEWSRVEQWDGGFERKYQAECVEYLDACKEKCSDDYAECSSCIKRKSFFAYRRKKSTEVPWVYTSALIYDTDKDGKLTGISDKLEVAVCSVRVINPIKEGNWANLVIVNVTKPSPPPRLMVSGEIEGRNFAGVILPGLVFEGSQPLEMSRLHKILPKYPVSSGIENQCCTGTHPISLQLPSARFWAYRNDRRPVTPTDFCRHWIQQAFYSVSDCLDDNTTTCMYMDDERTIGDGKSKVLFRSGDATLEAIACNPYKDVVVATSKQTDGSFSLVVYHATSDEAYQLNLEEACPTFSSKVYSRALEMDWKNDGKLMVVARDQEVWLLNLEYEKTCTAQKLSQLSLSPPQNVLELTADWQNYYFKTEDGQVTIQDRQDKSKHQQLGSLIETTPENCGSSYKPCRGLELDAFDSVFSIKATAPEMQKYLEASEYLPVLEEINSTMIDATTGKIDFTVRWNAKLASLRAPINIELYYKEFEDANNDSVDDAGCDWMNGKGNCKIIMYTENFRTNLISKTLPDLKNNTEYYIEGIIKVSDVGKYWRQQELLQKMRKHTVMTAFYKEPNRTTVVNLTKTEENRKLWIVAVALGLAMLFLLLLLIYGIFFYLTRVKPLKHLRRIKKNQVSKVALLGSGHFGEVWHGLLADKGAKQPVAIKYLHDSSDGEAKKSFLEEAIILGHINHSHIVKIIGISLDSKPNMIVLEYFNGGSLCKILQEDDMMMQDQLKVAIDVCKACVHLDQKGYIHRDIRSANVLIRLNSYGKVALAVLADFGLAKDRGAQMEPYTTAAPQFPIRYSAPECFNGRFSTKSDVFMYGILMWEIFSKARVPNASIANDDLGHQIQYENARPSQPDKCPDQMYRLMKDCWGREPESRPHFKKGSFANHVLLDLEILKRFLLRNKEQPINDFTAIDLSSVPAPVNTVETVVRPLSIEQNGIPGQMEEVDNVYALNADKNLRLAYS